ncbi:TlpA family protein disulfide reductase [Capnocytophaga canis]|uniref:TlpA family protein disulfide reductase n=1 Tax=Capnocytophaga canis TaxID=1848903 RepID=UPI00370D1B27
MKLRTVLNLGLILLVLAFFVTPLGYESKIILQRIFSSSVEVLPTNEQYKIDFDWKLKDRDNKEFNFSQSEGKKPSFVYFWSSWRVTSVADLSGIQKLYNDYKEKVDFYIITNELPSPVEELMSKRGYNFKVTYLIIGEKMPFDAEKIPSGYIIDKHGVVRAKSERIANWNSDKVRSLLDIISK